MGWRKIPKSQPMKILCGIPGAIETFIQKAEDLNVTLFISANAFWNPKTKEFQNWGRITERNIPFCLDCGGFVAMAKYGKYRWTIWDYIQFAMDSRPEWWAAMDYCCEPEIAKDKDTVQSRIRNTVFSLAETLTCLINLNREIPNYVTLPMPVLQGWKPQDYVDCIHMIEDSVWSSPDALAEIGVEGWPNLIGLGSVCRRQLTGENNLLEIINKIDNVLPPHTKLHLFGVKSQAVKLLKDHPRIESIDSMAWNMTGRWELLKTGIPKTQTNLANFMESWVEKQRSHAKPTPQLQFAI